MRFCRYLPLLLCVWGLWGQNLDIDTTKDGWQLELKRISLNFSSTSLKNQNLYSSFSNSRIRGTSQIVTQTFGEFDANFYAKNFVIFNSLLAEYGRNIISPQKGGKIDNKTLDRILLSTDYTQRIWKFESLGGFELGPYAQLSYRTEFTPQPGLNRIKILRFSSGFKIFEGKYVKNLYANLFGEEDFTYAKFAESLGVQMGFDIEQKVREGVDFTYHMDFKNYLLNNYPPSHNPQYELEFEARMNTNLYKNFSISPFVSFYMLKGRYFKEIGTNIFIGVSISYNQIFVNASQK
ncbi:hypothetical protein BKH46_06255 [Helicobacter sp. 12S02634-8]|uniref:hypothetical protein n=1 Tax=Helicobacter sp. 12S02634-8 TaxID=1476199 RepID=UPI000BA6D433|nr:hypothetical protein [Helicobacter sp. 12S02634-8]PAF46814.1 hypothetical protein BKH46_06255 [Helicobacter sp. 12S02634-8]